MRFGSSSALLLAAALLLQPASLSSSPAQEAGGGDPVIRIELNDLQPSNAGCRISFVATSNLSVDVSKAAFEVVLFNAKARVERLTVLDFRDLPSKRPRVRQFDLAGADCANISRVLLNGATACEGDGVAADACRRVETSTTGSVAFSG